LHAKTVEKMDANMASAKPKVLCFVDYYLPGYKAGGPTRTLINMVGVLGDEIDFHLVTRDRDFGSIEQYRGVQIDAWNTVGKAKVFYASPHMLSFGGVRRLIAETPHDVLYLNSFLSPKTTGLALLVRRLGLSQGKPTIIAPRGEFGPNALAIKALKKNIYLKVTTLTGFYRGLVWQASSEREVADIRRMQSGVAERIMVAPSLLPPGREMSGEGAARPPGPLRMIFLSRVAPMKNLDFLLRALAMSQLELSLSIYGTRDEPGYWTECESLIAALPPNVKAEYRGPVTPEQVADTFAQHDLLVLPTRGENFGHVIFESLAAGTPVLLSDQTPWRDDPDGTIETLPITDPALWLASIERWSRLDEAGIMARHAAALRFARNYIAKSPALEQNRALFREAFRLGRGGA
jgi:glycosyltransferase involved in cell wall biosynthesis